MENLTLYLLIAVLVTVIVFLLINLIKTRKERDTLAKKYKPIIDIDDEISKKTKEKENLDSQVSELSLKYKEAKLIFNNLERQIKTYQDDLELIEFGVYEPHFDFDTSEQYKARLLDNKAMQKTMIKNEKAAICRTDWAVGNSIKKGQMMIKRGIKLTNAIFG